MCEASKLVYKCLLLLAISLCAAEFANCQCTVTTNNDTAVCTTNTNIQLNAVANNALGYIWSTKEGLSDSTIANPIATPKKTTAYIVSAIMPDTAELVVNGDFEGGNSGFTSSYTYRSNPFPGGSNNLLEGQYTINSNPSATHQCFASCGDKTTGSGKMIIYNGSKNPNVAVWSQTITVSPNTDYAFSAWLQNVTCPPYGYNALLQFSINSTLIGNVFTSDSAICKWKQFYQVWNSGSSTSATISVINQYTSADGNDFALDNISFKKYCKGVDTVTITVNIPSSTQNIQKCTGDSIFVGGKYQKNSGTYYDTLTTSKGCDSIVTSIVQFGTITNSQSASICNGDSLYLQKKYQKTNGTYYDTLSTSSGCDSVIITTLTVSSNTSTTKDTIICGGDSVFVNGRYLKNTGSYVDTISITGSCLNLTTTNLTVQPSIFTPLNVTLCGNDSFLFANKYLRITGIYTDTVYRNNCPDTVKELNLVAKPILSSILEFKICNGDSIFWNGSFFKTDTLLYDTITRPSDCDSIVITSVFVAKNPIDIKDTAYYCDNYTSVDAGNFPSLLWSNGSTSRFLNVNTEGYYWLEVTDTNNCKFKDSVLVIERCDPVIFVPTAFTPNNDGVNDTFSISTYNIYHIKFIIFDRWGEILFETENPFFAWDGKYRDAALPTEAYHWLANFSGINREGRIVKQTQRGMIMLIR